MLRWLLLFSALLLLALASLTVVKSPDWAPWKLAVLAGEYGHWLAVLPLGIAALAWLSRGDSPLLAIGTVVVSALAVGCFLRPSVEAAQISLRLPEKLERQLGRVEIARAPFSVTGLFRGAPATVPAETMNYAGELALDFFRAVGRKNAPCVIVVHGGGWNSGDRGQIPRLNHWLAGHGYAVAAISYRLAPKFQWPAQRDDVLAAIAFLKSHAEQLDIDPARLVLLGRSAGGQIVEAVGYMSGEPALRGVVGLYAPGDMVWGYQFAREDDVIKSPVLMRQFLGGTPESARANYESASGYLHVTKAAPATLLLHGELDTLTWNRHSVRLAARLAENGVPHAFVSLPWATHAFDFNLSGPGGQLTTFSLEWFLAAATR